MISSRRRSSWGCALTVWGLLASCDTKNVTELSALRESLRQGNAADGGASDRTSKPAAVSGPGADGTCRRGLRLTAIGSYASGVFDEGAAEIVAHDPSTQRLFVVNAAASSVDVLDIHNPSEPLKLSTLDLTRYGASVNSVAVHHGVVAIAVEAEDKTDPGMAVFVDAASYKVLSAVRVGALPDMITWSPDGRVVLVANEGEPNADYSIDPEGSISIIDVSCDIAKLRQRDVRTADFHAFDGKKLAPSIRVFGPGASVSQDLEPEYITVSSDSSTAWVTLQENNALARLDIAAARVTELLPLGFKDFSQRGQGLDASDKDGLAQIQPWPVFGAYAPDAIASYEFWGRQYLVLANEGDLREYGDYKEEARVSDLTLDPKHFPAAAALQAEEQLGRLKVTSTLGDENGDGVYEALYAVGARSFSIRSADGRLIYDSGDAFERKTAALYPEHFNSSNDDNDFDSRSDDRGPEPEGVALGQAFGHTYAFIGLERIGGVMVYDVSIPYAPCYAGYANRRDFTAEPGTAEAADLGPEGVLFIAAAASPTHAPLLVIGNEISGTTTIFEIERR